MAFKVEAIKLTKNPRSTKVVYSKGDKTYLRTGQDNFKVGKHIPSPINSVVSRWGFRRVSNPPKVDKGEELMDLLKQDTFSIKRDGTVKFR